MASQPVRTLASLFLAFGLLATAAASYGDGEQCTADSCPKHSMLGTSWLQVGSKITQMSEEQPAHGAGEATQTAEKARLGENHAAFKNSMTMTASVTIDGALQTSGQLAAIFTDGELRGVTTSPAKIPFARPQKGRELFPLTIHGNGGGSVRFKFKSAADGKVIDLAETLPFVSDATRGNAEEPLSLTGSAPAASAPWSLNYAEWENSMTITSVVFINGVHQNSGSLGAFGPDGTCRGIAEPLFVPFGPYAGEFLFPLMTYANEPGETLSFKFATPDGVITDLAETMTFVTDGNKGDAMDPIHFTGPASPGPPCKDVYAGEWGTAFDCEIGKAWMLCAAEPDFMEAICKKTCGMC